MATGGRNKSIEASSDGACSSSSSSARDGRGGGGGRGGESSGAAANYAGPRRLSLEPRRDQYQKHALLQQRTIEGVSELEAVLSEESRRRKSSIPSGSLQPRTMQYEHNPLFERNEAGLTEFEACLMEHYKDRKGGKNAVAKQRVRNDADGAAGATGNCKTAASVEQPGSASVPAQPRHHTVSTSEIDDGMNRISLENNRRSSSDAAESQHHHGSGCVTGDVTSNHHHQHPQPTRDAERCSSEHSNLTVASKDVPNAASVLSCNTRRLSGSEHGGGASDNGKVKAKLADDKPTHPHPTS